jgi:hypothetical protein
MTPDDRLALVLADATKVHPKLPTYVEGERRTVGRAQCFPRERRPT